MADQSSLLAFACAVSLRGQSARSSFVKRTIHSFSLLQKRINVSGPTLFRNRSLSSSALNFPQSVASLLVPDEQTTYSIGHILGSDPRPADVLLLHGDLGVGKTAFARGYIHAASRDSSIHVTSPTFLLTNTYPCSERMSSECPTIYHMDLWRLDSALSRPIVDFEDVFRNAVSLIEWPDRLKTLQPSERLDIFIDYPPIDTQPASEDSDDPWGFGSGDLPDNTISQSDRYVRFTPHGQSWKDRLEQFYQQNVVQGDHGDFVLDNAVIKSI